MKFANKNLEKNIAAQTLVINRLQSDIEKLSVAMTKVKISEDEVIWDALWSKKYDLQKKNLPDAIEKLDSLNRQNETAFSNRINRRVDLIASMYTPERVIPA